jgi:hypothetical protein
VRNFIFILTLAVCLFLGGCRTVEPVNQEAGAEPSPALPQAAPSATAPLPAGEKIKETKSVAGTFRGFNAEGGFKAVIELAEDDTRDELLLGQDETLNYFLAANLDKPLEFTYHVIEGSKGTGTFDKMTTAKAGALTHEAWWQQQKAANPDEAALRQKYAALVEQATEKEDEP